MVISPAAKDIPVTSDAVVPAKVLSTGSHEKVDARRAETSTSATSEEASAVAAMPNDAVSTEPNPIRIVSPAWSPTEQTVKGAVGMFCGTR